MDLSKAYRFGPRFAFRRESFGGILYHYEGVRPDPRVTFVDHPFLIDLLERVEGRPLEAFLAEVCGHFSLPPADRAVIRNFFATLIERGALVELPAPSRNLTPYTSPPSRRGGEPQPSPGPSPRGGVNCTSPPGPSPRGGVNCPAVAAPDDGAPEAA